MKKFVSKGVRLGTGTTGKAKGVNNNKKIKDVTEAKNYAEERFPNMSKSEMDVFLYRIGRGSGDVPFNKKLDDAVKVKKFQARHGQFPKGKTKHDQKYFGSAPWRTEEELNTGYSKVDLGSGAARLHRKRLGFWVGD
jgi:hypothetical protein